VKAGRELARERLALYTRYAGLVARQESALDAEDMEAFETFGEELATLRSVIGAMPAAPSHLEEDPEAAEGAFVRQATEVLRATLARTERIQSRLAGMRAQQGADIRRFNRNRPLAQTYAAGVEPAVGVARRLDVKL
jgi:hypothetical protein